MATARSPQLPRITDMAAVPRSSAEIREAYLSFFEERDHLRVPSASLVPSVYDPSVLLTTAGMQPFRPYFLGLEPPPHPRLTSCQKCFRTTDIDQVGLTARHLTFFEMLGNFSFGDYFKQGAVEMAWELADRGASASIPSGSGSPSSRATTSSASARTRRRSSTGARWACPTSGSCGCRARRTSGRRGPSGPCGPCSELYYDRGLDYGSPEDLPGGENDRFLEFWNLVFMQLPAEGRRLGRAAPAAQHRHRLRARPRGGDPAGRAVGVRDRPVSARSSSLAEQLSGPHATDPTRPPPVRSGCWPTTAAR